MAPKHTKGFRTHPDKMRHYHEHIEIDHDFNCASADEYEDMADEFCGKPLTPNIQVYERQYGHKAGGVVRWDTATNEYGVVSADGYISTYFRVNYKYGTNQEYFDLERIKDENRKNTVK